MKLGNGLWEHVRYNSRFQPTEIGLGTAADRSAALLKLEYKYGTLVGGTLDPSKNNGNIQSQSIAVAARGTEPALSLKDEYEYDALNRLRAAHEGGGAVWRQTFDYDRFGNREVNAAGTTDSIELPRLDISGATNRITAPGYFYDAAGHLTDEPGHTYKYDAEGKLSEHDGGPQAFPAGGTFGYDGEGRRITKQEGITLTLFVYNALGQLVAEYSHAVRQGGTNYLTQDHLGNTRVVTDGAGRVVSRHDYLPFGEELHPHLSASGRERLASYNVGWVRQKYASKERDRETGLDYFGARYYSSAQGRFTSPDAPFADQYPQNPQSWNLYAYARNNPVRVGDLNGEITPWDVLDVVSLIISAYEFYQEPTLENAAWLAGDLVGAVLPVVPFGSIRRGVQGLELASDLLGAGHVVSKADEVGDAGRFMLKASDDFEGAGMNGVPWVLRQDADPLRETYGAARNSHPEEYQRAMSDLKESGVDVVFRKDGMAYQPGAPGDPGRLVFDPEGSIGALRHEMRHVNDARDLGYPGMRAMMENPADHWRFEYRGYMEEIRFARSQRDFKAGRQLVDIMRGERMRILGR